MLTLLASGEMNIRSFALSSILTTVPSSPTTRPLPILFANSPLSYSLQSPFSLFSLLSLYLSPVRPKNKTFTVNISLLKTKLSKLKQSSKSSCKISASPSVIFLLRLTLSVTLTPTWPFKTLSFIVVPICSSFTNKFRRLTPLTKKDPTTFNRVIPKTSSSVTAEKSTSGTES